MTLAIRSDDTPGLAGTRAAQVLGRMRLDILACRLRPGERLPFEALRASYGVSFTTLREGLTRLVAEGLVAAEGQRGFRVAPVTRADLLDLTDGRVLIEREALRLALERGDETWEAGMLSAFHVMDRLQLRLGADFVEEPAWNEAHRAFHLALVSACGSPLLLQIRASLFERAHRYRSISARFRPKRRPKSVEHRALMDAALARDGPRAADLMERHIRETTANVLSHAAHLLEGGGTQDEAGPS